MYWSDGAGAVRSIPCALSNELAVCLVVKWLCLYTFANHQMLFTMCSMGCLHIVYKTYMVVLEYTRRVLEASELVVADVGNGAEAAFAWHEAQKVNRNAKIG